MKYKRYFFFVLLILFIFWFINRGKLNGKEFNVIFLNVEHGDASLIFMDDKVLLLDAGDIGSGNKIITFLKERNINEIDYLIGTHAHADHIGGLDEVITNINVKNLFMPKSFAECTTIQCKEVITSAKSKSLEIKAPNKNVFKFDNGAKCKIINQEQTSSNLNNTSIILECNYKKVSLLFMGDAEVSLEKRLIPNLHDIDILKVGHHGSATSSALAFLEVVKPEYSIISANKAKTKNTYDLPKDKIINRLKKIGSEVYRTDLKGTVWLTTNGYKMNFTFDKKLVFN
jgi:beta-lactamase superfamily II metal-dependent hydrolase